MELVGILSSNIALGILGSVLFLLFLGFFAAPYIVWMIAIVAICFGFGFPMWLTTSVAGVLVIFLVTPLRRALISSQVMKIMISFIPKISETERTALEAGVVWIEADLFSGSPDFKKILAEPYPNLTAEEKKFIDGPVEEVCRMADSWKIWKNREIEEQIWQYLKDNKFLGMIIPKEYGGLAFSALAHSEVVMKLSSRSVPLCITVMVPNSLGPAELLAHYGTEKQKNHYLPRLAVGKEIPCFGLTEPLAGSDAGSITSEGVIYKSGDQVMMRLNWNKRYITLAAASTVVGLAFRMKDPENILGRGVDLGITCALIPSSTKGVILGRRHDPLGVPFYNCPTQGENVELSVEDCVVGGIAGVGKGWKMLMECLAAGRGISLPAQATGGAKLVTRATSAYSVIRQQFGVSIGKFEGIEEPLARIASQTYALEAMRKFTCGALDKGIKPPVITAMAKHYSTEIGRKIINDGMDVLGGAAISMGPRNLLAETYMATPIGITVEGANILTRTLIIFGQGALRAHPYAFKEVNAVEKKDLAAFDEAFWGHVGHVVKNLCRTVLLSISRGYLASSPVDGETAIYYRRLSWASASFAILSDIAMGALGGTLKIREKITGRFADILAWMYIATSTLRRFEAEGRKSDDLPYVHFVLKNSLVEIQKGFDGIYDNMKIPGLRWFFKGWLGAWSRINSMGSQASDGAGTRLVTTILGDTEMRNRLTEGIYLPKDRNQQLGRLDYALDLVMKAEGIEQKIRAAVKAKTLPKKKISDNLTEAVEKGIITAADVGLLKESLAARLDAIQVDDFDAKEYVSRI